MSSRGYMQIFRKIQGLIFEIVFLWIKSYGKYFGRQAARGPYPSGKDSSGKKNSRPPSTSWGAPSVIRRPSTKVLLSQDYGVRALILGWENVLISLNFLVLSRQDVF